MKTHALMNALIATAFGLATLPALGGGLEPEIEVGDARAFVIEILGEPEGRMGSEDYELLYFNRGQVELVNGKVTSVNLVSEAEAAKREAVRIMEAQERQRAADEAAKRQPPPKTATAKPAAKQKAPAKVPQSVDDLTPEQQAELEKRITAGIDEPPEKLSRSKLRRYQRGRSPSALEDRKAQITAEYMAELKTK